VSLLDPPRYRRSRRPRASPCPCHRMTGPRIYSGVASAATRRHRMARKIPVTIDPISMPPSAFRPSEKPTARRGHAGSARDDHLPLRARVTSRQPGRTRAGPCLPTALDLANCGGLLRRPGRRPATAACSTTQTGTAGCRRKRARTITADRLDQKLRCAPRPTSSYRTIEHQRASPSEHGVPLVTAFVVLLRHRGGL